MGNRRAREFMIQAERRAIWEQAQTRPRELIEDVTFPGIGIRRVQLVFAPSFEPGFAWDIRVFGDEEWWLFRSRLTELTEETVFEPTRLLGYEQLDESGETLRAYFDRLQSLTLPIGPLFNGMSGIDGTSFHLALFGDQHSQVRFQWWSKPPPQWAPLIGVANEMIEGFVKLQPKRLDQPIS
jgi:hypothetical protein